MDSSRPKTNDKDKFQFKISEYMYKCNAPFWAWCQFFAFTKISFVNIFPSLAILSHVDKTKIFKLTPNIPP